MNNYRYGCGTRRCPPPVRPNPLDGDPNIPTAMAYVKNERFGSIFDPMKALTVGTVFPDLYKPFQGSQCACRNSGRSYR